MTAAIEAGARAVIAARKKWESREGPFGVYDLGYPDNKIAQPNAVRDFRPEARGAVVARFDTHDEAMAQYEFLTEQHYAKACIEAAIASGELVPASAVADHWRDPSTAPKDGTPLILRSTFRVGEGSWGVCRPQQDGYRANNGEPTWRTADEEKIFPGTVNGWMPMPPSFISGQPDIQAQVAGAVAEMRERCAKKCDELGDEIMERAEVAHEEEEYDEYESLECAATEYSRAAAEIRQLPLPACGDYVVVPREPTPDMRIAGGIAWTEALPSSETYVDTADACYKAMLAVAGGKQP